MTRRTQTIWTFAITSIALFMVSLDNLVVTTALPVIRTDLGASLEDLEWTVNAYTLTFAVLLLTGAALGDRFGRRRMFSIGLGVFTLGSVAAALAPSVDALNIARATQGLGGAIVMPLTLTLLSAAVPAEKRGLALGAWGGIGGLAIAFGPLVGGAVVEGICVAVDLLAQRPDRRPPRADRDAAPRGEPRPGRPARPAGCRARERRAVRDRLGPRPRQRPGLGERRDRRLARASGSAARRRLRRLGAPGARADAADAVLPLGALLALERRLAPDVLRDVRLDLPARAVLSVRAGVLAARSGLRILPWTLAPMFIAPIAGALSDRIEPAADHRDGPGAAGDRARLDRDRVDADRRRTRS